RERVGHVGGLRDEQCERPGPERFGQDLGGIGKLRGPRADGVGPGGVDDERMAGGSTFDLEDPPYGGDVEGIGAQPVDGLGREGDEPAPSEQSGGVPDVTAAGRHPGAAARNSRAASMKANDSGVAKWSVFFSTTSVASGKASTSGSPGPAKSLS